MRSFFVLLFFSATLLCSEDLYSQGGAPGTRTATHYFSQDVLFFKAESNSSDSVRTDVFVAMPYGNLSFLNDGDRYVADYGVIVQVTDAETKALVLDKYQEHSVSESISMREKRVEIDQERANATQYSFQLGADKSYDIRVSLRDLNANVSADTIFNVRTPQLATGVKLSSPLLYRSRKGTQILPLIGSDVSTLNADEGGFFVELYGLDASATAPRSYYLAQYVYAKDDENEVTSPVFTWFKGDGTARQALFQSFDPSELWLGDYNVDLFVLPGDYDTSGVSLSDLRERALAKTSRSVRAPIQAGIPFSERDLDVAIDQINLIATVWEWDSVNMGKNRKEKRMNLIEFWRKRDPDPWDKGNRAMDVFYKRVAYANFHFNRMGNDGWRSDRGRVYIVLGEPSFIERSPYQATSKPYEVWEYHDLNVRYYFVDHYLLGDYRLTSPPPRQGVFLWDRGVF